MDSLFIYIYNLVLLLYCDLLPHTPYSGEEPDRDSNLWMGGSSDKDTNHYRQPHLTGPPYFTRPPHLIYSQDLGIEPDRNSSQATIDTGN